MTKFGQRHETIIFLNDAVHPEIFETVKTESLANFNKVLLTGYFFTKRDTCLLKLIRFLSPNLFIRIDRRIVESSPNLEVSRAGSVFAALHLAIRLLPKTMRTNMVLNLGHFFESCHRFVAIRKLARVCSRLSPKVVVYLSTFNVHPEQNPEILFFKIHFHGVVASEVAWYKVAALRWPSWSSTWQVEKMTSKIQKMDNVINIYSSSFSANSGETDIIGLNYIIPIGADASVANSKMTSPGTYFPNSSSPKFLFVGTLTLRKGLPDLFAAFDSIDDRAELLIIGNGSKVAIEMTENNLRDSVKLLQNATREQVLGAMSEADYFILPSYYEGFGIAIVEAMTLGCIPIVSTNTCGPDLLNQTSFGQYIFSPGDIDSLRDILIKCTRHQDSDRIRLKSEARNIAMKYNFENFARTLGKLITEAK